MPGHPEPGEGSRGVTLKLSQRDPSTSLRFAQDDSELSRIVGISDSCRRRAGRQPPQVLKTVNSGVVAIVPARL